MRYFQCPGRRNTLKGTHQSVFMSCLPSPCLPTLLNFTVCRIHTSANSPPLFNSTCFTSCQYSLCRVLSGTPAPSLISVFQQEVPSKCWNTFCWFLWKAPSRLPTCSSLLPGEPPPCSHRRPIPACHPLPLLTMHLRLLCKLYLGPLSFYWNYW